MAGLGAVPVGARLGHRARGLQRGRRRVGLLPARPRPLARLPLERGRPGRHLRRRGSGSASRSRSGTARDPILKERIFGLTGPEGNHGEDAKEYWWYLDSTPTHSWMRGATTTRRREFPYARAGRGERAPRPRRARVRAARHRRLRRRPLLGRHGRLRQGRARRPADARSPCPTAGPDAATLDVLPTLWFRNTWSWGRDRAAAAAARDRRPATARGRARTGLGTLLARRRRRRPTLLFCENETNTERLFGVAGPHAVPEGRHQRPRGQRRADGQPRRRRARRRPLRYRADGRPPARPREVRLRLSPTRAGRGDRSRDFDARDGRARARRPTSSTPRSTPARRRADEAPRACARRSPGCSGASSSSTTTSSAGWTATRPGRRRPTSARHGRNASWRAPQQRTT